MSDESPIGDLSGWASSMDDLSRSCCRNPGCPAHGQRDAGNLSARDRSGKDRPIRPLRREVRKARFSEREGTPPSRSCPPPEKADPVPEHVVEGNGVRQTGRLVGVHRDTVTRPARLAGEQARDARDGLVASPPQTREIQLDETWSFVAKEQRNRDPTDPADDHKGDWRDSVAYDAEHRLVLAVVPGSRSIEDAEEIVGEAHDRTGGRTDVQLTSDELAAYETAIEDVHGEPEAPRPPGTPGRPPIVPGRETPAGLAYATAHEERQEGRVVAITTAVVVGTWAAVAGALVRSTASRAIDTSFLERHHPTDRHHNARKSRKTYRPSFSKDWRMHEAMTYLTKYSDNFRWPARTLRERADSGRWRKRAPAMAAGLADHVWSIRACLLTVRKVMSVRPVLLYTPRDENQGLSRRTGAPAATRRPTLPRRILDRRDRRVPRHLSPDGLALARPISRPRPRWPEGSPRTGTAPQAHRHPGEDRPAMVAWQSHRAWVHDRVVDRRSAGPVDRGRVCHPLQPPLAQRVAEGSRLHSAEARASATRARPRGDRRLARLGLASDQEEGQASGGARRPDRRERPDDGPPARRTWAPRGQTPSPIQAGGHRKKVSVAAAIWLSPRRDHLGLYFHTPADGYFDNWYVTAFLEAMLRDPPGRFVVVWDGALCIKANRSANRRPIPPIG